MPATGQQPARQAGISSHEKLLAQVVVGGAAALGDFGAHQLGELQPWPTAADRLRLAGRLGGFLNPTGFAAEQPVGDDVAYAQLRGEGVIGHAPLTLRR